MAIRAALTAMTGAVTLAFLPLHAASPGQTGGMRDTATPVVRLYAAGSLRKAMTSIAHAFEAAKPGAKLELEFGASGLLRERIEKGETAHVFASADTAHPASLAGQGKVEGVPRVFARNALCAIARDGLAVDTGTLVDVLLQTSTRIGMSTPKADPAGDYALKFFQAVDKARPGAGTMLEAKALRLTGGPASPKAPDGRHLYAWIMSNGQADVFLTYCTNARLATIDAPTLKTIALPPALAVSADYGLAVMKDAPPPAAEFADFVLSPEGQRILTDLGFAAAPGAQTSREK